jgi:hypothetical protein
VPVTGAIPQKQVLPQLITQPYKPASLLTMPPGDLICQPNWMVLTKSPQEELNSIEQSSLTFVARFDFQSVNHKDEA